MFKKHELTYILTILFTHRDKRFKLCLWLDCIWNLLLIYWEYIEKSKNALWLSFGAYRDVVCGVNCISWVVASKISEGALRSKLIVDYSWVVSTICSEAIVEGYMLKCDLSNGHELPFGEQAGIVSLLLGHGVFRGRKLPMFSLVRVLSLNKSFEAY